MRLWTRQDESVLKEIEEKGYYRVSPLWIQNKYGTCSDVYFHVYEWFAQAAETFVKKPKGVYYPIWLATGEKYKISPIKGQALLELEVPDELVIIMDTAKWDYILNYWYLPTNEEDHFSYKEKLKAYGVHNATQMYINNFHPILKREVQESWMRLFDNTIRYSNISQATVWEIRKEWIVKISQVGNQIN